MLAIEKISLRNISNLIAGASLEVIVNQDRIGQTEVLLHCGNLHKIAHPIQVHSQNDYLLACCLLLHIKLLDDGQFLDTRRAGDGPEEKQDSLSTKVAELDCACPIQERECEIGSNVTNPRRSGRSSQRGI